MYNLYVDTDLSKAFHYALKIVKAFRANFDNYFLCGAYNFYKSGHIFRALRDTYFKEFGELSI